MSVEVTSATKRKNLEDELADTGSAKRQASEGELEDTNSTKRQTPVARRRRTPVRRMRTGISEDKADSGAECLSPAVASMHNVILSVLSTLKSASVKSGKMDINIAEPFQKLPSRRHLPDYYHIIREPMAFDTINQNIEKKKYDNDFRAFVKDCAQIFHNARLYNISSSQIAKDAVTMEHLLKQTMTELKNNGTIEDDSVPYIGEIPTSESSDNGSEEDEDDDEEEEDENGKRKRSRRRRSGKPASGSAKDGTSASIANDDEGEEKRGSQMIQRKRGRPPKVDTPHEARIKLVLRALRKYKENGRSLFEHFEKLPDPVQYPDYYETIKYPIANDRIKKRIKRREYKSLDHFLEDLSRMFHNARLYNEDDSIIHKDATKLLQVMERESKEALAVPDKDLVGANTDGGASGIARIPLTHIEWKGEIYETGDWVHIVNPNDTNLPIPSQIFRTFETTDGEKFINACWYYRPEQIVHPHNRKFFENEVFKTGQYRDHPMSEVLGKCFVMFYTRYPRGRPKDVGDRIVYVCESRYNENNKEINQIKTWKSCIPAESYHKDYEMYMFDKPMKMKKVRSPLLHLLPEHAPVHTGPAPEPRQWGNEKAPPVLGEIYRAERSPSPSSPSPPPREPTPPPPVTSVGIAPANTPAMQNYSSLASYGTGESNPLSSGSASVSIPNAHSSYTHSPYPTPPAYQPSSQSPAMQSLSHRPYYGRTAPTTQTPGNTAFFLPVDIPPELACQFQTDQSGRVMWFNVPPLDPIAPHYDGEALVHTSTYLSHQADILGRRTKRVLRDQELAKLG